MTCLTEQAFYDLSDVPRLRPLHDHWREIAAEAAALADTRMPIQRDGKDHTEVARDVMAYLQSGGDYGWMLGWGPGSVPERWTQFGLMMDDAPIPMAQPVAPRTLSLLDGIGGIHVGAFLRMEPHTFLPVHRHPELRPAGLLQMHITLEAAPDANYAYLNVEGTFRQHRLGEPIIFDGALDHFAVNASHHRRTILYLEFKR
ncbi:hypothetical protein JANAI62_20280 [Jannaschia pagri]|uniref:Aspartyl/asparaginy/proline hydroxylase domain-containing protein n=1 Tax=Jannaschia pagri TaxID=2829797 RepID=A0ABQ4NLW7_9RHOB|nr:MULTISPECIES: aspartyl/asparaginyl beta-hydroxylase domain-containing protein [unclassified Jannaschia]GIT91571.1 hypothetical protein JANAI61_20290 [Jannaschia sp. AI_61]GIT95405.1 hypothetical protein JANAI62_20280 [Jannaschia sp. AI_62]